MSVTTLVPDPGPLPTRPPPKPGERIVIKVEGLPPDKDVKFSIRNPRHRHHERFVALRRAAVLAMAGRARYLGPVEMNLKIRTSAMDRSIADYLGGIADTLDGSHGFTFTYLPIVYEDDFQISSVKTKRKAAKRASYEVSIRFLSHNWKPRISKELKEQVEHLMRRDRGAQRPFRPKFRID